jgi:flagellum-specific ATP synthase
MMDQDHVIDAGDRAGLLAEICGSLSQRPPLVRIGGRIVQASATSYRVAGLSGHLMIGDSVEFEREDRRFLAQVVNIDAATITIEPFDQAVSVGLGHPIWARGPMTLASDDSWKGRVIDALAQPIDGRGSLKQGPMQRNIDSVAPAPLHRRRVEQPLTTGVRVIDLFTPICAGQRIGIFAGSGVGKSTLLGMMARTRGFDTVVVCLVGERGREVREFVEDILAASLSRAVVVVATGDESPMTRRLAPKTAMTIAEHFRDRGDDVLLVIDSITRYAHALREVALAGGEPPVARGYAPSVFTDLPRLLERAGPGQGSQGTITGLFSVLVDGDDHNEPVADTVRGILDGHIVLNREVASRGQFPAVDVLQSISRLADKAWSKEQAQTAKRWKAMVTEYEATRELRQLGVYKPGASAELDRSVATVPRLYKFLTQAPDEPVGSDVFAELAEIMRGVA